MSDQPTETTSEEPILPPEGDEDTVVFDGATKSTSYGLIKPVQITKEMEKSYLDYAMSVIVARGRIVAVLVGDNVISRVRELLGPTNSKVAPKGTIRGDFGTEMMRNVCHASDSPAAAEAEVRRFFRPDEVFAPEASRV